MKLAAKRDFSDLKGEYFTINRKKRKLISLR